MASRRVEVIKFPRTKHLFNAGGTGVTRDDLLMDPGEEIAFYTQPQRRSSKNKVSCTQTLVSIEEKVDGANLGISIGEDMKLQVQNRAHFVNSKTHRQFSSLDSWLSEHSSELYDVLEERGKHVLFGEWLYAKHSIHYTRLPGYFMAFDLFSVEDGKFYSWRERNRRLKSTSIPIVRQIAETTLAGRDEALKWLDTSSAFYDGPCEGIYLRVDEDMSASHGGAALQATSSPYGKLRAKLVQPDFLQGIEEQWTRQQLTKNIIKFYCD